MPAFGPINRGPRSTQCAYLSMSLGWTSMAQVQLPRKSNISRVFVGDWQSFGLLGWVPNRRFPWKQMTWAARPILRVILNWSSLSFIFESWFKWFDFFRIIFSYILSVHRRATELLESVTHKCRFGCFSRFSSSVRFLRRWRTRMRREKAGKAGNCSNRIMGIAMMRKHMGLYHPICWGGYPAW